MGLVGVTTTGWWRKRCLQAFPPLAASPRKSVSNWTPFVEFVFKEQRDVISRAGLGSHYVTGQSDDIYIFLTVSKSHEKSKTTSKYWLWKDGHIHIILCPRAPLLKHINEQRWVTYSFIDMNTGAVVISAICVSGTSHGCGCSHFLQNTLHALPV